MANELDAARLLDSLSARREGALLLSDLFIDAGVNAVGDEELRQAVIAALTDRPDLVDLWQGYSWDKRWTPSPYLDGLEVGHYDAGKRHMRTHAGRVEACADFVVAEVRWLVEQRVIDGPSDPT